MECGWPVNSQTGDGTRGCSLAAIDLAEIVGRKFDRRCSNTLFQLSSRWTITVSELNAERRRAKTSRNQAVVRGLGSFAEQFLEDLEWQGVVSQGSSKISDDPQPA